jgi:hypothetical protein
VPHLQVMNEGDTTPWSVCANGHRLQEPPELPYEEHEPCPECSTLGRRVSKELHATVTARGFLTLRAKAGGRGRAFLIQKLDSTKRPRKGQRDSVSVMGGAWVEGSGRKRRPAASLRISDESCASEIAGRWDQEPACSVA